MSPVNMQIYYAKTLDRMQINDFISFKFNKIYYIFSNIQFIFGNIENNENII